MEAPIVTEKMTTEQIIERLYQVERQLEEEGSDSEAEGV